MHNPNNRPYIALSGALSENTLCEYVGGCRRHGGGYTEGNWNASLYGFKGHLPQPVAAVH